MPKVRYSSSKGLVIEPGSGFELSQLSVYPNGTGTTITSATETITLSAGDTGKIFLSDVAANHQKRVNVPTGAPIGTRYKIIQNTTIGNAGKELSVNLKAAGETFVVGSSASAGADGKGAVSAAGNNLFTINGHNNNPVWDVGSWLEIVKVTANSWHLRAVGQIKGTGAAGSFVFSTH